MAQETTTAQETAVNVEATLDKAVETVKNKDFSEIIHDLWTRYQADILHLGKILLISIAIVVLGYFAIKLFKKLINKSTQKLESVDESLGKALFAIARTIVWLFVALIILDLFGINTASFLTVLGAAGLAVGLAMKDSLSNIAAGVMLLIMRPYKAGDYIDCGSISGTIKEMGLFTTILMTVDGIYISAPNSVIFGTPIKNYSRNPQRRADITVGIDYADSLPKGVELLQKLLDSNDKILKDPAPQVLVAELADSSVNLTLRFWCTNENYWDVYWQVKAQLKNAIESAGLNIPFPQRVITFATPIPEKNKAE